MLVCGARRLLSLGLKITQEEGTALALQILTINLVGQDINYLNAQLRTSNDFKYTTLLFQCQTDSFPHLATNVSLTISRYSAGSINEVKL